MELRRSNRRLTITGSSVFAASTPMVANDVKRKLAGLSTTDESPQWVSAEEALKTLRTPKYTTISRRTTLSRQNIFKEDKMVGESRVNPEGFKLPGFFIPVSPPGVKTRSRRSSMYGGKANAQSKTKTSVMGIKKTLPVPKAKDRIAKKPITSTAKKDERKSVSNSRSRRSAIFGNDDFAVPLSAKNEKRAPVFHTPIPVKPSFKRVTEVEAVGYNDIEILSPIVNLDLTSASASAKKSIKSMPSSVVLDNTVNLTEFQTPQLTISNTIGNDGVVESEKSSALKSRRKSRRESKPIFPISDKPQSLSEESDRLMKISVPDFTGDSKIIEQRVTTGKNNDQLLMPEKLVPNSKAKKRVVSDEENEIDSVVKKMFSPSKSKSISPDMLIKKDRKMSRLAGSPARGAILKDAANTGVKSARKQRASSLSLLSQNTPSRAAHKARKILGVSQNITPTTKMAQGQRREDAIADDSVVSSTGSDDLCNLSEIENNVTLSHTSRTQWCTIL